MKEQMQRNRIRFGRGEHLKFISHLDIIRLWERAFRRARIPLVYSEGFNPHPRMSLAAPLAIGVTSEAELMDVFLSRPVAPHWFISAVSQQLPPGIEIYDVVQTAPALASLQSQVRYAEYRVQLDTAGTEGKNVFQSVENLLSLETLNWQHRRDTGSRNYDLRALIDEISVTDTPETGAILEMRLRCDSHGSGRPEQVVLALGIDQYPLSIHRTRLLLDI